MLIAIGVAVIGVAVSTIGGNLIGAKLAEELINSNKEKQTNS